jgi:hypothetical protein
MASATGARVDVWRLQAKEKKEEGNDDSDFEDN